MDAYTREWKQKTRRKATVLVDPWTMWVGIVWVHSHLDFFHASATKPLLFWSTPGYEYSSLGGVKSYMKIVDYMGVDTPNPHVVHELNCIYSPFKTCATKEYKEIMWIKRLTGRGGAEWKESFRFWFQLGRNNRPVVNEQMTMQKTEKRIAKQCSCHGRNGFT